MSRQRQRRIHGCAAAAAAFFTVAPVLSSVLAKVEAPASSNNTVVSSRGLAEFGAVCDGATDNAAAFAASVAWMKNAANREVRLPAAVCATSQTVTWGDGRQRSTTLSSGLAGGETAIPVADITGIQNGDGLVIVANDGSAVKAVVSGTPSAGSVPISGTYTGTAASAGKAVFAGNASTYHGGGFRGYGSCTTGAYFSGAPAISTIKYIGAAAPTTTLTATASAGATSLTVAAIAGIALGDPIRMTRDSGETFWTTVAETPTGTTVKIVNEVPSTVTSGATVAIANNPVVKIAGPIIAPVFEGVCLDANSLAGIGLQVTHAAGGKFRGPRGVLAKNYTGVGFFLHSHSALLNTNGGAADSEYELYAEAPGNNTTIGLWTLGHAGPISTPLRVAYSRNHFWGGRIMMGGNDSAAAAIREEWADNNNFYKVYTDTNGANVSGAGLYRQPSIGIANLGTENAYFAPALKGGVVDGTATGGSLGRNYFSGYATSDSEPVPTGKEHGWTMGTGKLFGVQGIALDGVGTTAAPSLTFGAADLGCFSPDASNLYCAAAGSNAIQISSGGAFKALRAFYTGTTTHTTGNLSTAGGLHNYIGVNKSVGAATTVTLTNSTDQNVTVCDEKGDAQSNPITVVASAGTIDGSANYVINTAYGCAEFHRNGTSALWKVTAQARPLQGPYVLCQGGAAVSHTGDTSETALRTCTVPGGALGANGQLIVHAAFTYNNDASNKTARVRFGGIAGTQCAGSVQTTNLGVRIIGLTIANRNAANSQVCTSGVAFTGALTSGAIDTAAAADLVFSGQLADAADTITLESYTVTLVPAP